MLIISSNPRLVLYFRYCFQCVEVLIHCAHHLFVLSCLVSIEDVLISYQFKPSISPVLTSIVLSVNSQRTPSVCVSLVLPNIAVVCLEVLLLLVQNPGQPCPAKHCFECVEVLIYSQCKPSVSSIMPSIAAAEPS